MAPAWPEAGGTTPSLSRAVSEQFLHSCRDPFLLDPVDQWISDNCLELSVDDHQMEGENLLTALLHLHEFAIANAIQSPQQLDRMVC